MHHCLPSPRWAAPLSLALGLLAGCASPPAASPRAAAPAVAPAALSNAQLPPPAPVFPRYVEPEADKAG